MDSEDSLSAHSSNLSSKSSNARSFTPHLSSASSENGPNSQKEQHNNREVDRFEENTIGFDSFSDFSDDPLNQGIIRNQDSFFSQYKSLYSSGSRHRFNEFSNSMDENEIQNHYESNSFSSFYSFASSNQYENINSSRKRGRQRSREKPKRQDKQQVGFYMVQDLADPHSKRMEGQFRKKK